MSDKVPAKRVEQRQNAFLAAFAETANVSLACKASGVGRVTHYAWLKEYPSYKEAFEMAREEAGERLEQEALRRAVEGVEEPVWWQGQQVGTVRKYSDTLLIFLMKGNMPDKYRERISAEHSGPNGGPIEEKLNVVFQNMPRPVRDDRMLSGSGQTTDEQQ